MVSGDALESSKPPDKRPSRNDVGADTIARYRYQMICAANECISLLNERLNIESIYCEQEDDILVKTNDEFFYAIQVKTKRDSLIRANDKEKVVSPLLNFVEHEKLYSDLFKQYRLVTNHGFESATGKRRYIDLKQVLEDVRKHSSSDIGDYPIAGMWWQKCFGKQHPETILKVLKKLTIDWYGDFSTAENNFAVSLSEIEEFSTLSLQQAKLVAAEIIAVLEAKGIKDLVAHKRHLSLYEADPYEAYDLACIEQRRMTADILRAIVNKTRTQSLFSEPVPITSPGDISEMNELLEKQQKLLSRMAVVAAEEDKSNEFADELKGLRILVEAGQYLAAENAYKLLLPKVEARGLVTSIRKIRINLGVCKLNRDDLVGAEECFRSVVAADDRDVLALANLAQVESLQGNLDQALIHSSRATTVDDKNEFAGCVHIMVLDLKGQIDALAQFREKNNWLESTVNGQLVLGQIALKNQDFREAERFFGAVLEKDERNIQARCLLATALYKKLDSERDSITKFCMSDKKRVILKEIKKHFDEAIDGLRLRDRGGLIVDALVNRSSIASMLDQMDEAEADAKEALAILPDNEDALRIRGNILLQRGNSREAIPILQRAQLRGADVRISLAAAFHLEGRNEEALKELHQETIEDNCRSLIALDIRASCYRVLRLREQLQECLDLIERTWSNSFDGKIILANQYRLSGEEDKAIEILEQLLVDDSLGVEKHSIAANQLGIIYYHLYDYSKAAAILKSIETSSVKHISFPYLLTSLANSGDYKEAYDLAKSQRNEGFESELNLDVEASIAMYVGAFSDSEKLYRRLVSIEPTNPKYKISLVRSLLRQNRIADGIAALGSLNESMVLEEPEHCAELAAIYNHIDKPAEALRWAYEALRRNPSSPKIYELYLSVFFSNPDDSPLLAPPASVVSGVAVTLRNAQTNQLSQFIVVEEGQHVVQSQEIKPNEHLGLLLAGKTKGDEVVVSGNTLLLVEDLKSKYVAALHRAMGEYEMRFPDEGGLLSVSEHQEIILLASIERRAKWAKYVISLYEQRQGTFADTARALGATYFELWRTLVTGRGARFSCFDGDNAVISREISSINAGTPVLDTSALLTLGHLGLLDPIGALFEEILVPTFVLDDLSRGLARFDSVGGRESQFAVYDEVKGYRMISENQNWIDEGRRLLEVLIDFVERRTKMQTSYQCLAGGREKFDHLCDRLGPSGFIAWGIVSEANNRIFYSDDWLVRSTARNLLGVQTTWIVPVLSVLRDSGRISEYEWNEAIFKLTLSSYSFLPIGPENLFWILKRNDMRIDSDVDFAFRHLENKSISDESLTDVLSAFLKLVWINELVPERRAFIVELVAAILVRRKATDRTIHKLLDKVNQKLSVAGSVDELNSLLITSIGVMRGII